MAKSRAEHAVHRGRGVSEGFRTDVSVLLRRPERGVPKHLQCDLCLRLPEAIGGPGRRVDLYTRPSVGDQPSTTLQLPRRVTELAGFPFPSFEEFVASVKRGEVFLSVDRSFALRFVGIYPTKYQGKRTRLFLSVLGYGMIWVGLVAALVAWPQLGMAGLALVLVSLIASFVSRPWMGHTPALLALGAACTAWSQSWSWLMWIGITWFVTYLVINYAYEHATNLFTKDLLEDEFLVTRALIPPCQARLLPTNRPGVLSEPWPAPTLWAGSSHPAHLDFPPFFRVPRQ